MGEDLRSTPKWSRERWETNGKAVMYGYRCESIELVSQNMQLDQPTLRRYGIRGAQFGSANMVMPSCLNIDSAPMKDGTQATRMGGLYRINDAFYFLQADANEALPLDSHSLEWVYAEHFIEHLTLGEGIEWLKEVRRLLENDGIVRLTTPDLTKYVEGYLDDNGFYAEHRRKVQEIGLKPDMPERRAFMLNQIFLFWGHRWIYDEDELLYALTEAGFGDTDVQRAAFRTGQIATVARFDREVRCDESLYIEATRR